MAAGRSVAVLGPIPRDRIITHNGEIFEKYGCALYTVAALAALLDPDDRIRPIVHVRREDEDAIKEMLSQFPNVDLTGVRSALDRGDVVELDLHRPEPTGSSGRPHFMAPITPADVEFALDADSFVCVPITDYQVEPGHAGATSSRTAPARSCWTPTGPPVTLVTRAASARDRLWIERDAWLPYIDILKMNLEEAGCSWFPRRTPRAPRRPRDPMADGGAARLFAEHCLRRGVQAVCVTLDQRGCAVYYLDADGALQEEQVDRTQGGRTSSTPPAAATRSPRAWRSAS